ncbi:MAG: histidine phosphatase family protein [Clostridia bacterium]|nr:histidine phosphatase family protein [Clostridia bacterium]
MVCYLVRHGKDDGSVRGGWSSSPLTEEGVQQVNTLVEYLDKVQISFEIKHVYSSDLERAKQTASPIAKRLHLPITLLSEFREANNGVLAGMDNERAKLLYPGLFWNTLEWEEKYPGGESPKDFYERICNAWGYYANEWARQNENILLVTHSGVMNIILSLIHGEEYSNRSKARKIPHTTLVPLTFEHGHWIEISNAKSTT